LNFVTSLLIEISRRWLLTACSTRFMTLKMYRGSFGQVTF
jgi:hypothetical protein